MEVGQSIMNKQVYYVYFTHFLLNFMITFYFESKKVTLI